MSIYHIRIVPDDGWYLAQADEDETVFSQARTLDEVVVMIRDVLAELKQDLDAELRLIVPATLPVDDLRVSGRVTHPVDSDACSVNEAEPRQLGRKAAS